MLENFLRYFAGHVFRLAIAGVSLTDILKEEIDTKMVVGRSLACPLGRHLQRTPSSCTRPKGRDFCLRKRGRKVKRIVVGGGVCPCDFVADILQIEILVSVFQTYSGKDLLKHLGFDNLEHGPRC